MRILVDTHYVLWAALNAARMSTWARELIEDLDNEILVSAASVYEISLKVGLGKLPEAALFERDLIENIEKQMGFQLLALDAGSMLRAARFPREHADPFDRMIAAQAAQHNLPLLSVDSRMETFGVQLLRQTDLPS